MAAASSPVRSRNCRLRPGSAMHLLPVPRDQEAAPIPPAAQPAGRNLSPPLQTPASSGTLEKLCPLPTQVGKLRRGAAGRREGWLPPSTFSFFFFTWSCGPGAPGALARRCPRGLPRATRRPASPGAGKPVPSCPRPSARLAAPRGGAAAPRSPLARSPAAPTVGAAPAPPGSRLPTSGLPGSPPPPPPHHMAAPATGSRRKPEAAAAPPPPPSAGRRPLASAFLLAAGTERDQAGPGQGCTLAAAPARPGGLHALVAPEEGAGLSAPKGSSARP